MRAAAIVYRLVLLGYPAAFRRRFGRAMEQSFIDRCAEAARRGRVASLACIARALADVLVTLVVLRISAARDRLLWPDPLTARQQHRRSDMWWQVLLTDARFAWRMFLRNPVFSGLAVVALALGIGANAAIFSIVDGVLLRPLPYGHADRLVMLSSGVLGLVLRQGLSLAAIGAVLGVAASAAITPSLGSQLFGVRAADPVTFIGVPLLVLAVAAVACLVPARRTMRIDPVSALRAE